MAAEEIVAEVRNTLWGNAVKEEVFRRWAQGFYFSPDEPSALIQDNGGPCAVIAPLQAFILKQLLLELADMVTWRDVTPESCDQLLVRAMTEILAQAADPQETKYSVLLVDKSTRSSDDSGSSLPNGEVPVDQKSESMDAETTAQPVLDSKTFHSLLRIHTLGTVEEVEKFLTDNISMFKGQFGVLLLLYSVICTKGIAQMRLEISDLTDPLIHSTFGYGSQSLINLMLSGRAVSNVWDHDQDVGGLKLKGIEKQNEVGFLTLLETLRYIEVGSFLKSPSYPVWVLGSETHLTVLFSAEKKLVSAETRSEQAKRVFKKYDNDGNNFIPTDSLQNVLAELDLFSDTEYVDIIKKKLDRHNDGIILLNNFMYEFFPEDPRTLPDTFVLHHYNGLPRSNPDNKVKYHRGQAILLESAVNSFADNNSMLTVLQTKWPSIEIQWESNQEPSIN
ncbi:ubiquitin carboxyl-terminal hydrolase MINDY-3 homolog [Copidosoma floridanum]|uniref:ubiquitin carboxyl-terminal hydrolase MINDY-3 homolog n=1 Tax=Copidosoma floridanum TaxID=29053 RepID=UPI0006C93C47|nr:ubiquitin carboxyl-terminal hydrolase MINDY-3 homolog [Copidosoma floridanum]XP_014211790.1 ubiquitin carboxyl-terminal hydrolase MINDY-3 homolog [Copidosoma floridanum]XP_014211791.1 ubiquitin carboxyl-terminal hydrolase MINDY-3 homolog [Copidosoma floridanum]